MAIAMVGRFAADLLALSRPVASLCAGAQIVVGAHLTGSGASTLGEATILRESVAIVLIVAAVNVVNDIVDVDADAISRPGRPLPTGRLTRATAWRLAGAESAIALTLSVGIPAAIVVNPVLLLLGFYYSYKLKSTVLAGNLTTAFLAATPIVYGGWLGGVRPATSLMAAGLVFMFMFAFEVLKTIRDEEADRAAGYRTVATQWGAQATSAIFQGSLVVYALFAAIPILLATVTSAYSALIWPGAVIPPILAGWLLPVAHSPSAVRKVLLVMTLSWFPGLAALAVGFHG
ncbi:UbiA family prenyltransferase [Rhodococcus koreensis]